MWLFVSLSRTLDQGLCNLRASECETSTFSPWLIFCDCDILQRNSLTKNKSRQINKHKTARKKQTIIRKAATLRNGIICSNHVDVDAIHPHKNTKNVLQYGKYLFLQILFPSLNLLLCAKFSLVGILCIYSEKSCWLKVYIIPYFIIVIVNCTDPFNKLG